MPEKGVLNTNVVGAISTRKYCSIVLSPSVERKGFGTINRLGGVETTKYVSLSKEHSGFCRF